MKTRCKKSDSSEKKFDRLPTYRDISYSHSPLRVKSVIVYVVTDVIVKIVMMMFFISFTLHETTMDGKGGKGVEHFIDCVEGVLIKFVF